MNPPMTTGPWDSPFGNALKAPVNCGSVPLIGLNKVGTRRLGPYRVSKNGSQPAIDVPHTLCKTLRHLSSGRPKARRRSDHTVGNGNPLQEQSYKSTSAVYKQSLRWETADACRQFLLHKTMERMGCIVRKRKARILFRTQMGQPRILGIENMSSTIEVARECGWSGSCDFGGPTWLVTGTFHSQSTPATDAARSTGTVKYWQLSFAPT